MKKFIIGVITSLLLINSSYGQETTNIDSLSAFKKVNKWAVVKLSIAYIEDLRGWSSETDEKRLNTNQKIEWETYKKLNDKYSKFTNDINLESVSKNLSTGWVKTRDEIFKAYKLELIDSIKRFNFNEVVFNPEKTQTTSNRKRALVAINKQFGELIPEKIEKLSNTGQKVVKPQDFKNSTIIQKEEIDWLKMILNTLLLLSLIFNIFLLFSNSKNKNKDRNKDKKGNHEDFHREENIALKQKNRRLEEELSQFKIEKTTTTNTDDYKNIVINQEEKPIEDAKPTIFEFNVPQIKKNLIYFPSPFEERRFTIEDASPVEKPTSLYVANVNENTNKGDISLIETADLSKALNSPNIYLETACEYENAYNSEAKSIKVIEEGVVVLEGEDWVVKSKVKIKFI